MQGVRVVGVRRSVVWRSGVRVLGGTDERREFRAGPQRDAVREPDRHQVQRGADAGVREGVRGRLVVAARVGVPFVEGLPDVREQAGVQFGVDLVVDVGAAPHPLLHLPARVEDRAAARDEGAVQAVPASQAMLDLQVAAQGERLVPAGRELGPGRPGARPAAARRSSRAWRRQARVRAAADVLLPAAVEVADAAARVRQEHNLRHAFQHALVAAFALAQGAVGGEAFR